MGDKGRVADLGGNVEEEREARMDRHDRMILEVLSTNGRLPITELARRIGLSKSPTQARLRRLEKDGVITGYRALIDPIRIGRDHVAFVEVKLSDTREAALSAFNAGVVQIPEVEECHMLAAEFDYLLKVRCRNMRDYRRVLGEEISALPHVAHSTTHVAMQAVKEGPLGDVN